jgi:UDP-N-acetylglucosamine 1-carboxyvinyltransferase
VARIVAMVRPYWQPVDRIVVRAGGPLSGAIRIGGAKNSVLKLMAAAILADGIYEITNVPDIADVRIMSDLLVAMGLDVVLTPAPRSSHDGVPGPAALRIVRRSAVSTEAPYELVERIRASIVVLGPLLARCGVARVSMPGGDDFGARPIDMHLKGLEALGASFELRHGYLEGRADGLRGASITLEFPSVGATENIVMAAVHAKGTTVLDNAAREPEIGDLCAFLNAMGAQIEGVGSSTLVVHGVEPGMLRPADHRVVADRLEAATYLAAVGVTGGEVTLREARAEHMGMIMAKLVEMGMTITDTGTGLWARSSGRLRSVDVATLPYPGVATDYKPLVTAMLCVSDGVGIVTENLFAGRFRYVEELVRLGADIRTDSHHAVVRGVGRLSGAPVRAHDIRAGASLVVAGLAADGETVISGAHHIDRGYENIVGKLRSIGADIERLP